MSDLTREIIEIPAVEGKSEALIQIRVIEKDGSCKSEPCYPASLFSDADAISAFADSIIARTEKERAQRVIDMARAAEMDI